MTSTPSQATTRAGRQARIVALLSAQSVHSQSELAALLAADGIEDDANLHQVRGRAALVRQGIAVQLANPKPAVFFGTIFLTLVPRDAPIWALAVILLMIFVNDAGWNMIVGRIFAFRRSRATYLNLKTVIDRVFGGLLALLGLKLATT